MHEHSIHFSDHLCHNATSYMLQNFKKQNKIKVLYLISSSSSSGPGAYAPDALQPIGLVCDPYPPVILDVPTSATGHLHVHTTWEILAAKGGTVGENVGRQFCLNVDFHVIFRDLLHAANLWHGTDTLLPVRRKARWGFFRSEKSWRLRPGLNPRTWVLKGSTLPIDHRSHLSQDILQIVTVFWQLL